MNNVYMRNYVSSGVSPNAELRLTSSSKHAPENLQYGVGAQKGQFHLASDALCLVQKLLGLYKAHGSAQ